LKADISNLMLLCDKHHRLVDKAEVDLHPVERLTAMKKGHEQRLDVLTGIAGEKQSHVLLYGANIGTQNAKVSAAGAARAMIPERYRDQSSADIKRLLPSSDTSSPQAKSAREIRATLR